MKPSKGSATTESVTPTKKTVSFNGIDIRFGYPRPTVAGNLLPFSPSFLLLLAAFMFAAFTSPSSFVAHATATTTTSDVQKGVEEIASTRSEGSSQTIEEDNLLDEENLTTSSSSSCVDDTVLRLKEENRALEAEISVLRAERDPALKTHSGTTQDLRARLDKCEQKEWLSATQSNVALSTKLMLSSLLERRLVSVSSSDGGVPRVGVRRLADSCPEFLLAGDAALVASDGWNLLSVNCTLGATFNVSGAGKRIKIKKSPSAEGVVEVDRQATSVNQGRHFFVANGAVLEVNGLIFTGGYETVRYFFCIQYVTRITYHTSGLVIVIIIKKICIGTTAAIFA